MHAIQEVNDENSDSASSSETDPIGDSMKPIYRSTYKRSVSRGGYCAMRKIHRVSNINYYTKDMFTSLVDSRWRCILLIFTFSFVFTWFFFALLWWVIAYAHGDLKISPYTNSDIEPCITQVEDLMTSFLFSMETQYTTGYGTRAPTAQCPEAIFLLCVQSIFGMLQQSVMVGVVFAKLARPKARTLAIKFSEKAVVCQRDGTLCLMLRLADVRKSHLISCSIRAWLLQHRISHEGEILPNYQQKLKVSVDEGGEDLFLLWPITVVHRIDSKSPLYDLSALELFSAEFEVVISLTCTAETTGQATEARRSYTPTEILWGYRFQTIVQREHSGLQVDYELFNKTIQVDTPLCSARQLNSWSQPTSPDTPTTKNFPFIPSWAPVTRDTRMTGYQHIKHQELSSV